MKFVKYMIIFLTAIFVAAGCASHRMAPIGDTAMEVMEEAGKRIKEAGDPAIEAAKQIMEEAGKRIR